MRRDEGDWDGDQPRRRYQDEGGTPRRRGQGERRRRRVDEDDLEEPREGGGIPVWVWVTGGSALGLLVLGGFVAVLLAVLAEKNAPPARSAPPPLPPGDMTPRPQPTLADWSADETLLAELADRKAIPGNPGCSIRPPKGYEQQALDVAPGTPLTGARWASPARPDGTETRLLVMIGRRQPGEAASPLDQFARNFLASRQKLVGTLRLQPMEYGRVGGLTFGRVRWSAEHPVTKQRSRGFVYVATPGQADIMIDSQDVEPHHASTLKLAEAAALTFRFSRDRD